MFMMIAGWVRVRRIGVLGVGVGKAGFGGGTHCISSSGDWESPVKSTISVDLPGFARDFGVTYFLAAGVLTRCLNVEAAGCFGLCRLLPGGSSK